jgi:hypothetical protein
MYSLIVDGDNKSANGTFYNFNDALYWYNYAWENGANSAALWQNETLIQYFIKEQK